MTHRIYFYDYDWKRTMTMHQDDSGWPCVCGSYFTTGRGMKIRRSKKGCTGAIPGILQWPVIVAAVAVNLLDDHGGASPTVS